MTQTKSDYTPRVAEGGQILNRKELRRRGMRVARKACLTRFGREPIQTIQRVDGSFTNFRCVLKTGKVLHMRVKADMSRIVEWS